MTKVNIKRLDSVTKNDTTATKLINDNFNAIQEAIENTLSRDGTTPNFMDADIDLNSRRIINSANPEEDTDLVTLGYVKESIDNARVYAESAENSANKAYTLAVSASISAETALTSRNEAVAAKEAIDELVKDDNIVTVATDLKATPSNIKTVSTNISDVSTVADDITNVKNVSNNIDNVNIVAADKANIDIVAGDISDVSTVAAGIASVAAVASIAGAVTAVNANKDNINTVAGSIDSVNDVAMIKDDVVMVSGSASDIMTVADSITDVNAVAGSINNVDAVATDLVNINRVTEDLANVDTVATNINYVKDVSTNINIINTVADSSTNINVVATNISNVNTVKDNIADISSVAENIDDVKEAVASAEEARKWAVGTITEQPEGSSKYWAEQAKAIVNIDEATETTAGIIRLATDVEASTGFDDSAAMTPLKTAKVVYDNVGRGIQLGFAGTLEGDTLTFETTDENPYTIKQGYCYEIDLLFQAAGILPDDVKVVIKNGADTINIVNVLHDDYTKPITVGCLKQLMKYNDVAGWRWVFNSRFTVAQDGTKVFVMPSTVVNAATDVIYNRLHDALLANPDMIRYENDTSITKILAGSTFVYPNGFGVFDERTITNNIQTQVFPDHDQLIFTNGTQLFYIDADKTFAGETAPTAYEAMLWYDTAANKIKYTGNSGTSWSEGYALPFGTANSSGIVDCFCNGIGYFANCVWILDGVEVLIPNGKQEDGSFNNITYTVTRPLVFTFDDTREGEWALGPSGIIVASQGFEISEQNKVINKQTQAIVNGCPMGKFKTTTGRVETLEIREILDLTISNSSESSGGGSGLEIGDIGIAPFGIDETKNLRRYLNGQVISQSQFSTFADKVKAAVQTYPSLVTTEANWQAEVTNSKLGQCGKFVIDDTAGTIRLPKVVNINGLQNLSNLGAIKAESLPNITGDVVPYSGAGITKADGTFTGAFIKGDVTLNAVLQNVDVASNSLGFDASRVSTTYQDNAPVQQESVQYPYFIQVATGNEESADITTEIQLNNPFVLFESKWSENTITNTSWLISNGAFHSGVTYVTAYQALVVENNASIAAGTTVTLPNGTSYTKRGLNVKLSTEDYTDFDFVLNTSDTTFRLPVKVKLASGNAVAGNGMTLGLTNGTNDVSLVGSGGSGSYVYGGATVGQPVTSTGQGVGKAFGGSLGITKDPTKSGIETSAQGLYLYFYVGETIQDANVINAAGVLTTIADLKQTITAITDTSGSVALASNKIYTMTISDTTTFILPTSIDKTVFNQIKVMAKIIGLPTISWGTAQFFNKSTPDIEEGSYDFYFDYDNLLEDWVVGAITKGLE